ncbi:MAG: hypothetical protein ACRDI2_19445, partial [Chloroflexota bacterium]
SAPSAAPPSGSTAIGSREPVRLPAAASSSVRLSSHASAGRAAVYDLSVAGAAEYVANGILVHNCVYDHIARLSLPRPTPLVPPESVTKLSTWQV